MSLEMYHVLKKKPTEVHSLLRKIQDQRFDEFIKSLQLSVGTVPSGSLTPVHEKMTDAVYLQTPSFSPKSFSLRIPENNPNFDRSGSEYYPHYFEIQIWITNECCLCRPWISSFPSEANVHHHELLSVSSRVVGWICVEQGRGQKRQSI